MLPYCYWQDKSPSLGSGYSSVRTRPTCAQAGADFGGWKSAISRRDFAPIAVDPISGEIADTGDRVCATRAGPLRNGLNCSAAPDETKRNGSKAADSRGGTDGEGRVDNGNNRAGRVVSC